MYQKNNPISELTNNDLSNQKISRKIIKFVTFVGCLGGLLYQSKSFLNIYWSYPTVVDVQVVHREKIDMPSITVCNANRYRRSEFCKTYPESCEKLNSPKEFCSLYPHVCETAQTIYMPKPYVIPETSNCNHSAQKKFGHSFHPLVRRFEALRSEDTFEVLNKSFIRVSLSEGITCPRNCYVLNSVVEKLKHDLVQVHLHTEERKIMKLFLDLEPEEYSYPNKSAPEALLSMQSSYEIFNPYVRGFTVKAGNIYYVDINMEEKILLKRPYGTACFDFIKEWKKRNVTGPYTWEMCVHHCKLNRTRFSCNCASHRVVYPHDLPFCSRDEEECISKLRLEECYTFCEQECNSYSFTYQVSHKVIPNDLLRFYEWIYPVNVRNSLRKRSVILIFSVERSEFLVYKYLPKFELIEACSSIGGFMGMWLGISFCVIFDYFEDVVVRIYKRYEERRKRIKVITLWINPEKTNKEGRKFKSAV